MTKAVINIKADKEVKESAQKIAEELGLSLSDVVNASLRNLIRTREVYFSAVPRMTPELEKMLCEMETDIKKRENMSPRLSSTEEIEKYLDAL